MYKGQVNFLKTMSFHINYDCFQKHQKQTSRNGKQESNVISFLQILPFVAIFLNPFLASKFSDLKLETFRLKPFPFQGHCPKCSSIIMPLIKKLVRHIINGMLRLHSPNQVCPLLAYKLACELSEKQWDLNSYRSLQYLRVLSK